MQTGGMMQERLEKLLQEGLTELDSAQGEDGLQSWKVKYLGRSAELSEITRSLGILCIFSVPFKRNCNYSRFPAENGIQGL
jgi:hypothetical protein